jgi:hypothetical protein
MGFGTGMALGSDGTIYAWGDNSEGQLGNGSTTNIATPVPVSLPGGIAATAISAGAATNFAVASDGNVYAWGGNNDGQLGNGSVTGSATPVQVPFPAGVTVAAVYAGDQTEFAIAGYPAAPQSAGSMAVTVAVPQTGMLTVTVSTGAIDLALQGATAPLVATGSLNTVTVTDTRNTVPGWSVSGQDTAFTGSGTAASSSIPGDELGWAPSGTVPAGATLGPSVAPGASPGLADAAQVLASAAPGAGMGTASVSATLTLDIPATAHAGPYTGTLTITYLISGP